MPWIIGGCGCLTLLAILIGIICFLVYRAKEKVAQLQRDAKTTIESIKEDQRRALTLPTSSVAPRSTTTPSSRTDSTPITRAGLTTYVNEKDKIPASLREKFVAFSFQYPRSFEVQPQSNANFIKVEKYASAGKGNTAENFAVGYAVFNDPSTQSAELYDNVLDQLGQQLGAGFLNYKETKRTYTRVDGINSRTVLFQGAIKDAPSISIYGKTILVHPPGKPNGVTILMLGTSMSRDVTKPDDLGTKGETADILRSFKFL